MKRAMAIISVTLLTVIIPNCTAWAGQGMNTWDDDRRLSVRSNSENNIIALIVLGAMLYAAPVFTLYLMSGIGLAGLIFGSKDREFLAFALFFGCGFAALYFHNQKRNKRDVKT